MACETPKPEYLPHSNVGIHAAISRGDGYTVGLYWNRAYIDTTGYSLGYNIYYSTLKNDVFTEGPKFVVIDSAQTSVDIQGLTPGDLYYFAVRAFEFDPSWYDLNLLPYSGDSKVYPEGILLSDLTQSSTTIPVSDVDQFPSYGIIRVGYELIQYTGIDLGSSSLTGLTRGFNSSNIHLHEIDGYDGYTTISDNLVHFWNGFEDANSVIFQETCAFAYPNYARTDTDGFKSINEDLLTTELGGTDESLGAVSVSDGGTSDNAQDALPSYDYSGWHRTDPLALLRGDCIGTYYGGQRYCADGYLGVGRVIRGLPIQVENAQRQEILLNVTGEPVVLVRGSWTGIRCSCFMANTEYPEARCPKCLGTSFEVGFEQFFNPRRSDGRILVRFGPTEDDVKTQEGGLESTFIPDCWTLVVPAIKDRDFIIRFNEDGSEEFRYEILNVTRNKLLNTTSGAQKFRAQRVRKTDPIYQFRAFRDTSTMPSVISTGLGMVAGPGGIPPHSHTVVISEQITSVSQINETTNVVQGHSHSIINGVISSSINHSHSLILP